MDGMIADFATHERDLSQSEIQGYANGNIPSNGLVGYWPLDINNSGTTPDVSSYANDGTVNGPTLVGNTPSDVSGALSGATSSYSYTNLLNGEKYETFVHSGTERIERTLDRLDNLDNVAANNVTATTVNSPSYDGTAVKVDWDSNANSWEVELNWNPSSDVDISGYERLFWWAYPGPNATDKMDVLIKDSTTGNYSRVNPAKETQTETGGWYSVPLDEYTNRDLTSVTWIQIQTGPLSAESYTVFDHLGLGRLNETRDS
jgi:hypothetical protein